MADVPKRILERGERLGNEYAWVEPLKIDMGKAGIRDYYRTGTPPSSHVIPLLADGKVLLVHQYRVMGVGWTYEFPAGFIDKMESPEATALRELEEEAGYKAEEIEPLLTYRPSANSDATVHLFVARKLRKTKPNREPTEHDITVHEVTPTQLWEMVMDGTITDSQTIIGTLLAKERGHLKIDKKKLEKHPF